MPTQPHLLLLQKSMVMEEGVATALDPDINMWETAEPFLRDWLRSELGPEAYYADRLIELIRAVKLIPELIQRMAIRAIVGIGEDVAGSLFLFDGVTLDWRKIRLPKDPNCKTCGGVNAAG